MALRTVPWLTLKRAASSISLGMASPGFHSPARKLFKIKLLICWYKGLNAGVELGADCPPISGANELLSLMMSTDDCMVGCLAFWLAVVFANHILYKT